MLSLKVEVKGIVQGVGFRPYIYNLAIKHNIKGWVNNDDKGVNILLYSDEESCKNFIKELKKNPPKLAKIDSIKIEKIISKKVYSDFKIKESFSSNSKSTIISPDIGICDDCIKDINDKGNPRYNYALTNCTNCGPRYSIIDTVPYDRKNTSMKNFTLCKNCESEYTNPTNRRYHAQPVSCEKCGPDVSLYNKYDEKQNESIKAIKQSAKLIQQGYIIAIKGMGGFHIVCDATNDKVVKELRERKNRPNKPFAVMFKNLKSVKNYTKITKKEEEYLTSKEKPIVILKRKKKTNISNEVSKKINTLGCFIAYTPLHCLLFRYLDNPIIATSANLKGEPILRFKEEVIKGLSNVVDFVLDFNRDIVNSCDDSVIQVVNKNILKIRNARAYAPTPFNFESLNEKDILSLGANQKSTISIFFKNNLILSPYIANLHSIKSIEYFKRTIKTFERFYDFKPDIVVCDKHPNYESVNYAKTLDIKIVQVQHHYAHILSCMAEYKLKKDVLGFAFDGTGYGDDGNIWGGEVFICNQKKYKRVNHFKYFKLLGGENAIKEPRRIALSLLFDLYSLEEIQSLDKDFLKTFKPNEIKQFHQMWSKEINTVNTSSIGRLFDGIASLSGILHFQDFEAQSGLMIENYYDKKIKDYYNFEIIDNQIDLSKMIKSILLEKSKKTICSKFINTIGQVIIKISDLNSHLPIVLSGGVFQNKMLLQYLIKELSRLKKPYYYSKKVPLNDEGISVGQIYHLL